MYDQKEYYEITVGEQKQSNQQRCEGYKCESVNW